MMRDGGNGPVMGSMDRTPPYSEEAERGVLGSILLDSGRVVDLAIEAGLPEEAFFVPAHRRIFEAVLGMSLSGDAIDVLTLAEKLKATDSLDSVGGPLALDRLIDSTPTAAHAEYYIDLVRQKFLLRRVIAAARKAEASCYDDPDADNLLSEVEQSFMEITENQHGSLTMWSDAVQEVMVHVEKVFTTKQGLGDAISTGLRNLDSKLNGLRGGEMVVLAARPSMGKTSLAMNIAENVAMGHLDAEGKRHCVGIFSLEMSYESLVTRMLCCRARVSGFHLQRGYLSPEYHGKLVQAASDLRKAPIVIDDTGGLDILELRARARRMKKKHNIELIVIDYLQLMHSKEYSRQGKQVETSAISSGVKAMAKELRVPVIVLSQLSRAPEQRGSADSRPKLSDLRDSGAIEQDADVVMMLRRPSYYPGSEGSDDARLAMVDVAKQRNGPTGEVPLDFERDYTRFSDRAMTHDEGGGSETEVTI
jgi:replicative DNA helicase